MVKITKEYLIKHSDGLKMHVLRRKNETDDDFLKRVTHLKLQGKYVEQLDDLKSCRNITFLYLQNNILQTIDNLDCFTKLTHLYLQRNKIVKMENLNCLANLKKLYLGYNEISVMEGVENLNMLREFHFEYQSLPLGETVYFDPRSINSLSVCLEIFNISGNGLHSLLPLQHMQNLVELLAAENKIVDLSDIGYVLKTWPKLLRINLAGNPVQSQRNFKDTVILNSHCLRYLDDIEIAPTSRTFLQGWKKARSQKSKASGQVKSEGNLPVPRAVHFPQFMTTRNELPTRNNTQPIPLTFPAWKLRNNVNSYDEKSSPRPSRLRTRQRLDETI